MRHRLVCKECGQSFTKDRVQPYCSASCASKVKARTQWSSGRQRAPRIELRCETCGAQFTEKASKHRFQRRRYCSIPCANKAPRYRRPAKPLRLGTGGRMYITCRDGSEVAYYRALVEAEIGRHLRTDEVVHHLNGDPTDDRIENLALTTPADHIEMHREDLRDGLRRALA